MIDLTGCVALPFLAKQTYYGSYKGMRFALSKVTVEDEAKIQATIWPEPYGEAATPDDKKTQETFPFDKDGLLQSVSWMNEQHPKFVAEE